MHKPVSPTLLKPSSIYTIQTSGTTGDPKCIYVPEASILPNILDITNLFEISPRDVILLASALTFDMGILEIFLAIVNNATLLIVSEMAKRLPLHLLNVILNNGVTILQATPSLLRLLYASALTSKPNILTWNKMIKQLKILALGGECCPSINELRLWVKDLRNQQSFTHKSRKLKIFNFYGLTEQSCWSMFYEIPSCALYEENYDGCNEIPLGQPFSNTRVLIRNLPPMSLNKINYKVTKEDVLGELCIGPLEKCKNKMDDVIYEMEGPSMKDMNGSRLCYDSKGDPLPKLLPTGDIVAIRRNAERSADLYFVGRLVHELEGDVCAKRSGHRISTSAIEDVARRCVEVPECSIIYVNTFNEGEKTQINLFLFVAHGSEAESFDPEVIKLALRKYLKANLPYYSLPDRICILSQTLLPLTSHGKLDRSKLNDLIPKQKPEDLAPLDLLSKEWRLRTTPHESAVCASADIPSRDASFLFSGGDSLSAISLSELLSLSTGHVIAPWIFLEDLLYRNYGAIFDRLSHFCAEGAPPEVTQPKKLKLTRNELVVVEGNLQKSELCLNDASLMKIAIQGHSTYRFSGYTDLKNALSPFNHQVTFGHSVIMADVHPWAIRIVSQCHVGKCLDATPLVVTDLDHVTPSGGERVYAGCHSGWFYAFESVVSCRPEHLKMAPTSSMPEMENRIVWKTYLGGRIEASAAISPRSNLILVGSYDYNVYALDRENGVVKWTFTCAGEVKSCPAIDPLKDIAYVGCHGKQLYAIDVAAGLPIWTLQCPDGSSIFSSPCLNPASRCVVFATLKGYVYGVRTRDATLLWSYSFTSKPIFSSVCYWAAPHSYAFAGVDGNVYIFKAVDPTSDGFDDVENVKCEPFVLKTRGSVFASLAVFSNFLFAVSYDGSLYTLKVEDGSEIELISVVKVGTSDLYAAPRPFVVKNGQKCEILVLVVDKEGNINLIEPLKGCILCKFALGASTYSSPVISGCNIYIGTRDDRFIQLQLF